MSKKKQTTTTKNTYKYMTPPDTAGQQQYLDSINKMENTVDPTIQWQAANAKQDVEQNFDNPFGADYSPEVRDAGVQARTAEIDQAAGTAYRQDRHRRQAVATAQRGAYASMTAPQLVQSGGTQTQTQSGGLFGQILGATASIAGSALGNPALGAKLG